MRAPLIFVCYVERAKGKVAVYKNIPMCRWSSCRAQRLETEYLRCHPIQSDNDYSLQTRTQTYKVISSAKLLFNLKKQIEKPRGERQRQREGRGEERKGERLMILLTYAHSGQYKIIVRTTTNRDTRLGLRKVYASQSGVARLQATKERPFHGIRVILIKRLGCLLRRALRLARVFVLWNGCYDVVVHG